jgi:hypothetical protein
MSLKIPKHGTCACLLGNNETRILTRPVFVMQSSGRASSDIECDNYERLVTLPKGNDPLGDKNGTENKTHQVAWTSRHKPINPA